MNESRFHWWGHHCIIIPKTVCHTRTKHTHEPAHAQNTHTHAYTHTSTHVHKKRIHTHNARTITHTNIHARTHTVSHNTSCLRMTSSAVMLTASFCFRICKIRSVRCAVRATFYCTVSPRFSICWEQIGLHFEYSFQLLKIHNFGTSFFLSQTRRKLFLQVWQRGVWRGGGDVAKVFFSALSQSVTNGSRSKKMSLSVDKAIKACGSSVTDLLQLWLTIVKFFPHRLLLSFHSFLFLRRNHAKVWCILSAV